MLQKLILSDEADDAQVAEAARMALLRDRLGQLLVGPIAEPHA